MILLILIKRLISQPSIRSSIYFSSIVKSRLSPFLEPTSTTQWGFVLKETMGAFDHPLVCKLITVIVMSHWNTIFITSCCVIRKGRDILI